MSNEIYPASPIPIRGLTWTVLKQSEDSTIVQRGPNAVELRIAQWQNPIWHWSLIYDYLKDNPNDLNIGNSYTDYRLLQAFWLARQGQFDDFLFDDPSDDFVGPALLPSMAPNPQAQLQTVNDGAGTYYSPIQRNFGGQFYEDITDLNGSIVVYDNGTLKTSGTDYTIVGPGLAIPGYSFMGLVIQWAAPPTTPVTAEFYFHFRVRFESDTADFEQFMQQLWTIGGSSGQNGAGTLKLVSSRAAISI